MLSAVRVVGVGVWHDAHGVRAYRFQYRDLALAPLFYCSCIEVGLFFGERRCHDGHHILYSERTDAHLVGLSFHKVHLAVVGMQHGRHCRLYAEEL